ncbi:hypothetical protein V496_09304 [Pseudogymnoascus sp. VKM F-4515 (FW-2607)]|nr:hypothetical protein V496_09304 [Pseudogymnoascus sp. VKM F-4515 (FW-2607)]
MSEKFELSHSPYKYNISPAQLLSTPPPSSISSTRTPSRVPNPSPTRPAPPAPPTPPTMPATNPTYHLVHAFDSPSIVDDDDASSPPPTARLIKPSFHTASVHTPQKGTHTLTTIYPTLLLRVIVLALLSASIALFSIKGEELPASVVYSIPGGPFHTVPTLIFLSFAAVRTGVAIGFPVSRTARWMGARGLNAAVDAGLLAALLATTIVASDHRDWSRQWEGANKPAFIIAWVATSLYALAALDTGSPDRFYIKMVRLSLGVDFRFRADAMAADEWDVEAEDVVRRRK